MTVRDLRNHGGQVLDRVARGEEVIVTRDGAPAGELRPVRRRALASAELIRRAKKLPYVDPESLRHDVDAIIDQSL